MSGVVGGFTNAMVIASGQPELPNIKDFFASRNFVPRNSICNESHYFSAIIDDDHNHACIWYQCRASKVSSISLAEFS